MGIKEDLAERKAGFVSLRALLEAICAHEDVTLQEAATWLSERLAPLDDDDAPTWQEFKPGRGVFDVAGSRSATAWHALQHIVRDGRFANSWELDPDDIPF
ncbi:hypothetical protein [Burkholderia aenigmatica]|uniref:hypothetical protein n=1 Tax=Burkholderia aenigmatica TaxID=2015348 RepID=UPI0026514865|nr:hypothetical protein [Burkholderia aenigmatica]MDN7878203.1 hypothetical protein [Burkholderia aenigmatica]